MKYLCLLYAPMLYLTMKLPEVSFNTVGGAVTGNLC